MVIRPALMGMGAMKLIVGLGNPGQAYAHNRHNLGFMVADRFAEAHRLSLKRRVARSLVGRGQACGETVAVAKPQSYMNLSGQAVASLLAQLKLPLADLLVVLDDVDLPLGTIRLRPAGGPGTHNGMRSIVEALSVEAFARLRLGINSPEQPDLVDFVLSDFSPEELPAAREMVDRAAEAICVFLRQGLQAAMNQYNQ